MRKSRSLSDISYSIISTLDELNSNLTHRKRKGSYIDTLMQGCNGYVTGGGTNAVVFIPSVLQQDITNASVTALIASIRTSNGGYLGGSENIDLTSNIIKTTISLAQGIIVVTLNKSAGWGVTNNTPLCGDVKISYTLS